MSTLEHFVTVGMQPCRFLMPEICAPRYLSVALADSWAPWSNQKIPALVCLLDPQGLGCVLLLTVSTTQGGCHGMGQTRTKCRRIWPRALVVAELGERENMTSWGSGSPGGLGVGLELERVQAKGRGCPEEGNSWK